MIDYLRLEQIQSPTELRVRVLEAVTVAGDDIALSDALVRHTPASGLVLQYLEQEQTMGMVDPTTRRRNPERRRRFKIRVLKDMYGEPVKTGEQIEWKANIRRRDLMGKKYSSRDMMDFKRQGREEEIFEYHAAIVDADGCITVGYQDAGALLVNHGVHYETGAPLCRYRETSTKPKKMPDGTERIVHNWLYVEVPPGREPSALAENASPAKRGRRKASLVN